MHFSNSKFPNRGNNLITFLYHIVEDQSRLQLLGDLNNDVAIKPKESHLEVKFVIGA